MPAPADPFARSRVCLESLAGDLVGGRAGEMTRDQLEGLAGARGRELERQLLQDHPGLRALREEQALAAGRDQRRAEGRTGRVERGRERGLATVSGPVTVRRLACRAPGQPSIYLADAALSLPKGRHSHGLARLAVRGAGRRRASGSSRNWSGPPPAIPAASTPGASPCRGPARCCWSSAPAARAS
jgi:hypothetical protein